MQTADATSQCATACCGCGTGCEPTTSSACSSDCESPVSEVAAETSPPRPREVADNDDASPPIPSGPLNLETLLKHVSEQLTSITHVPLPSRKKIQQLLGQFDWSLGELDRFKFVDPCKLYTRNKVAATPEFTLLLLCWNPGKSSPIHDHPCNGCWMRVLCGSVVETRYSRDAATNKLKNTGECAAVEGDVIYIDDSIGLHKVTNPSPTAPACTLHLYSPPFTSCSIWLDETADADKSLKPVVTYYSEFGERVCYEKASALCTGNRADCVAGEEGGACAAGSTTTGCGALARSGSA